MCFPGRCAFQQMMSSFAEIIMIIIMASMPSTALAAENRQTPNRRWRRLLEHQRLKSVSTNVNPILLGPYHVHTSTLTTWGCDWN